MMNVPAEPEVNLSPFTDFPYFPMVRQEGLVIIYERMYGNLSHFIPMKNNTTNELERCFIRLELSRDSNYTKHEIKIAVFRHFPSGTDYGAHDLEDINLDKDLAPLSEFRNEGEFFYEGWSGLVYRGKNRKGYAIPKLLEQLYQAHIRPCRILAGFTYRKKKALAYGFPDFTEKFFPVIKGLLKVVSGKRLEFDYSDPNNRESFLMVPIKYSRIKPIPELVFKTPIGYECAKPTAIWSILTILFAIYLLYRFAGIDKNSILIAMMALISCLVFLIYDYIVPLILLFFMNWMIKNQYNFEPTVKI